MVKLGDHELNKYQICEDVPDLVKLVTSSLSFDPDAVLAQLSPSPVRFRRRKGKRSPCKTGYYLPSRSNAKRKEWFNWRATCKDRKPGQFATFLNEITDNVRQFTRGAGWKTGKTDLVFMEKPKLKGPSTDMGDVPDFVLVEREKAKSQDPTWNDVHCVGALRTDPETELSEIVTELGEFAKRCITKRHELRFVLGLAFFAHNTTIEFRLIVFDRTGTLCSQIFDIDRKPIDFLRGVIGLPLMSPTNLGGDPTYLAKDDDKYIRVADVDYKILRIAFIRDWMNGKGTRCYEVEGPDGKRYAARDSWTLPSATFRESEFLELIKDVENVPRIVQQEIVKIKPESGESFLDSTKHLRASILKFRAEPEAFDVWNGLNWTHRKWAPEIRDHLRTIISPCGQELTEFSSLPELVSAVLDVLETVDKLNDRGMWHSDISTGNIILVPVEGSPYRKGYLIDFETAVKRGSERFIEMEFFTTIMTSPDILLRRSSRNALHEAESILYVLLFIALMYEGPGGKLRQEFDFYDSLFGKSLSTNRYYCYDLEERKARARKEIMENAKSFESCVLQDLSPYFNPIKNCLSLLRDAIFSPDQSFYGLDYNEIPIDEWLRIGKERGEQRIKSILAKCKGILRDTLVELSDPKVPVNNQPIPDKVTPPSCLEDRTLESEDVVSGGPAPSKAPSAVKMIKMAAATEANVNATTVGEDTSCDPPQQNLDPDKSEDPRKCALQHTSLKAPSPLRRPLKRLLSEKDLNVEGDCPEIRAKRLKVSTKEVECSI